MIDDIKKAFRKSAVYSLGNMSTKLIGLILIPLYTDQDYLTISDYGALGILETTSQVLVALLSLTLSQSLTRWYWDDRYRDQQKSIFFTSMSFLLGTSALSLAVLLSFASPLSNLLFDSTDLSYVVKLVLINSVLQILITHVQTLLKLQSRAFYYSLIGIIKMGLSLLLTLYFIIHKGKKLDGIFEAQFIASVVVILILVPYVIRQTQMRFEKKILLEMLNYSYPLMLASVSGVFFSVIDRYSLNFMDGLDRVGIYNLGFKIASTLKVVVISSVQLALSPFLMKWINHPDNKAFYAKVMNYFGAGLMFFVIGLSLFSLEVIKVASKDSIYWESVNIVAILAFSFFFSMLKDSALIGLNVVKKTKIVGSLIVVASLVNLGMNILLVPRFSIYGAAVGTLISQMIFFALVYIAAQRVYRIPYSLPRVTKVIVIGLLITVAGLFMNDLSIGIRIILKTVLLLSYPVAVYLSGIFDKSEKEYLIRVLRSGKIPSNLR